MVVAGELPQLRTARALEPPSPDDLYSASADYVGHHREHKARIAKLDALANGDWSTVWPDGTVTQDMPKVADFVSSDLDDLAALVAGPDPTIVVDPSSDQPEDVRDATNRQHILATYRRVNRLPITRRKLALDLIGTGLACIVIWPDLGADRSVAYPRFIRKDPRYVYPDPSLVLPDQVSSLVVSYKTKARLLAATYPQLKEELFTKQEQREFISADIDVIEFYDSDWCIKVAAKVGSSQSWMRGSPKQARVVELSRLRNYVGKPLVVIATRSTSDGQLRGQFDKAIAPLGTANKMVEMHLAQLADMIYSEKIVRGVFDNPDDVGPGATLYTTDPSAAIDRAKTAGSHPQLYNDVQLLLAQSREAAGVPAARHGDIEQNIASAQFVNAIQGKYITAVGEYQRRLGDMEERMNSLALAVDETYLSTDEGGREIAKMISGVAGGRAFSGTYLPRTDIAGRYENRVVYGAGSGMDSYNRRVATIQDVQFGMVSRRTARGQLDYVEDVLAEESAIAREQMEQGFVTGLADPGTPLPIRVRALRLAAEGKSVMEIAQVLDEQMQAEQAAQAATTELLTPSPTEPALPTLPSLPRR